MKVITKLIDLFNTYYSAFIQRVKPHYDVMNRYSLVIHIILACFLTFTIEAISRHSIIEGFQFIFLSFFAFLLNAFLIFATLSIVYLFRRRVFLRLLISAIWLMLGISNGVLLSVRVTPFNVQDLKVLQDAIGLSLQYFTIVDILVKGGGLVAGIFIIVMVWKKADRYMGKIRYIVSTLGILLSFGLYVMFVQLAIETKVVSNYFENIAFAYEDYGFAYCFTAGIFQAGISQPRDYSLEKMQAINYNGRLTHNSIAMEADQRPNIIIVQLESFFDPTEVKWLSFSEDPIPNLRRLMDQYSGGHFIVPTIGAGTANTEFEVLTGMNMRFFGPGEYPYKTYARYHPIESVASALGAFGYTTFAMHNNGGNFYSRAHVFNNMGFHHFVCKEFMNITATTPSGWAYDDVLLPTIQDCLDYTEGKDFIFTISVQSHGDYPTEQVLMDPPIKVNAEGREDVYAWEYYVNQLHDTDRFVGQLIEYLEMRDEPTVVVFYGDHLPTLDLKNEDLKSDNLFNTNYVIWDNMGLNRIKNSFYAYQLVSNLFGLLGYDVGTLFNFHHTRINTLGYIDDLKLIQYDLLYGKQYLYQDVQLPFAFNHMYMGLVSTSIDYFYRAIDGSYIIRGENFTKNSKIFVNDNQEKTSYIADNRLMLSNVDLQDGDIITVKQLGSSKTVFRTGQRYEFNAGTLTPIGHNPADGIPGREAFDDEMPAPL